MNTNGSVIILFFCFLTLFTLTDCTCETNILEGTTLPFKLSDRPHKDDDRFTIKKDNKVLVRKKNKNQEGPGILEKEFLLLQNVKRNYSGTYSVENFDVSGRNIQSYTKTVCVLAKVPKPRVNITCQDEKINLRCEVEGDKIQLFAWHNNGKELKKTKENDLTNVKPDNSAYTCTAENAVHSNKSDPAIASCYTPVMLFGFERWTMVAIIAGGITLILLLITVLVTIPYCSRKRTKKHQQGILCPISDEEEFRLNYLNTSQPPQKSKQTARGQPAPPEPVDNGSAPYVAQAPCQTAPRTRNQQRVRPPPPPIDEDEEQPPPLPQPRKKAQAKKREGPL